MNDNDIELGYEQVYRERLEETRSMVTLATLLDFLDQGAGDGYDYDSVMAKARAIAERANQDGLPSPTPEVTLASSVIRSNVKIMIYNIIEFTVTSLIRAIYDRLKDENCGYADVSEKLRRFGTAHGCAHLATPMPATKPPCALVNNCLMRSS